MKVLLSWLREFAPFEGAPAELADQMSDLGMAVEALDLLGEGLDGVVVGRVAGLRPHPNADKIQLVDVELGRGDAVQVCCGAFNMAVGDVIPFATLGTTMPNGMTIERRKLRGEWSNGMCCSASELGLGADHGGIMILEPGLELGAPIREALGVEADALFDLEINGNRPDAMSVLGVARDLAARLRVPFALPEPKAPAGPGPDAGERLRVELLDPDLCGRFAVRVLTNVAVGPSPQRIANRLLACGMRPINNVVDASNYVMLELGHPNHTFDLAKIAGRTLRVRRAREGERLVTLDGIERELTVRDGVIADRSDRVVSLAGVMGGASTEIDEATTEIALEMAWWRPLSIAHTSKRLGLRSEASARFERGVDPGVVELAMLRFAELLAPSGAALAPGMVDERGNLPAPPVVRVRTERVNRLLGASLSAERVRELLAPIGFAGQPDGPDTLVSVPSFRPDSATEIDVIEEIARHHGYSNIAKTVPASVQPGRLSDRQAARRALRSVLVGFGVSEAMPLPFLAPGELERAGLDSQGIEVTNPLVKEESIMRPSLRPGLLRTLGYNASHRNFGVHLFELGHVYRPPADPAAELPDEREQLAVVLGDAEAPAAVELWWAVAEALGVGEWTLQAAEAPGLHPTRSARIQAGAAVLGWVGEIDPAAAAAFDAPERIGLLELDLDAVLAARAGDRPFRPFSRFPSSDLDLAFDTAETVPAAAVLATLRGAGGPLVAEADLFDVYRGEQVGPGRRSLAFRLRLQSPERTLTDDDLASVRQRCIAAVEAAHDAALRG
ncbi:MAG: phenylalanine--tRNA ligase subunit beta [Acidimicrobiales bacterium]